MMTMLLNVECGYPEVISVEVVQFRCWNPEVIYVEAMHFRCCFEVCCRLILEAVYVSIEVVQFICCFEYWLQGREMK